MRRLVDCLARLERLGQAVTVYPDAEELIQRRLFQQRMAERMAEIRKDPARHPLRKQLLKVELLPYQLDGIAFAAGAGRAILADDMGLGKTIQGVGAAEMLAREAGIRRVLVVCPASLKSQWRSEIHRFSDRSVQLVIGGAAERAAPVRQRRLLHRLQLRAGAPRHPGHRAGPLGPDHPGRGAADQELGVEDGPGHQGAEVAVRPGAERHAAGEPAGRAVFGGRSSSTTAGCRPAFRFFHRHRVVDEKGKVLGYKNLDQLRENLRPDPAAAARGSRCSSSCRRARREIVRIPPTDEQLDCTRPTCASCR